MGHNESDVLALDPVILRQVLIQQVFPPLFGIRHHGRIPVNLRQRIERRDAVAVLRIELLEQLRLLGAFDRVVPGQVAQRVDLDPVSGRHDQRNRTAVAKQIVKYGAFLGQLHPKTEIAPLVDNGRIHDPTSLRRNHFQQHGIVRQSRERALDTRFAILSARCDQHGQGNDRKNLFHTVSSRIINTVVTAGPKHETRDFFKVTKID